MSQLPDLNIPPAGYQPPPQQGSSRTISILLVVVGLVVFCLCILPICVIVVLALLGPAIGNIFSSINAGITILPLLGTLVSLRG